MTAAAPSVPARPALVRLVEAEAPRWHVRPVDHPSRRRLGPVPQSLNPRPRDWGRLAVMARPQGRAHGAEALGVSVRRSDRWAVLGGHGRNGAG